MYTAPSPPPTVDEIRALAQQATVGVPTAGRCWGLGTVASYDAVRDGTFPVPVIKVGGKKLRVRTTDLLASLGISADSSGGPDAA